MRVSLFLAFIANSQKKLARYKTVALISTFVNSTSTLKSLPRRPLEYQHEHSCGLHGGLLVEPLKLESDAEDVVLGFLARLALEGKLTGEEDVEKDTQAPNVRLRECFGFLQNFRC